MKPHQLRTYAIDAPGKCLLTGGYLILEEGNQGISLALSAYSHSSICVTYEEEEIAKLEIDSPELSSQWSY